MKSHAVKGSRNATRKEANRTASRIKRGGKKVLKERARGGVKIRTGKKRDRKKMLRNRRAVKTKNVRPRTPAAKRISKTS